MLDHRGLTPKAADTAEYLSDVEWVNLRDYLPGVLLLLHVHLQVRIRMGDVPIHLTDCVGVFQGYVAILARLACYQLRVGGSTDGPAYCERYPTKTLRHACFVPGLAMCFPKARR